MKTISSRLLAISLIFVVLAAPATTIACSSGYGTQPTTSSTVPISGNTVIMTNFSFSPATITIRQGTTVTWTNKDGAFHTVTSDTGVFDSGNMSPNSTFSYKFTSPGTFTYYCAIHPFMKGTVIVR